MTNDKGKEEMSLEYIQETLSEIEEEDTETAHIIEDDLYKEFLEYIANGGTDNLVEKAKLILTSQELLTERWYA
jgi:hypothetical protein